MMEGAIFDFDGTLFDSMFIWDTIGTDYFRSIGYEAPENLNQTFKSMSLYQAACYSRSEYGITLSAQEIMDGVNRMIAHFYDDVVQPRDGITGFLQELKRRGVKMCIATATEKHLIEAALERCGMGEYFTEIFTCSSVGHGKDEPYIFREALTHLGTGKQNTMVFEDALYAICTAKQDGFKVVGVHDKFEEQQGKVKELADIYLLDFSDFDTFWKSTSGL